MYEVSIETSPSIEACNQAGIVVVGVEILNWWTNDFSSCGQGLRMELAIGRGLPFVCAQGLYKKLAIGRDIDQLEDFVK